VVLTSGTLRVIDLTVSEVRSAVREGQDAKALYEGSTASDY
jgi:hypothetical protein